MERWTADLADKIGGNFELHGQGGETLRLLGHFGAGIVVQRDQPLVDEIPIRAPGTFTSELANELFDTGNDSDVLLLDVEEQRARYFVLTASNVFELRLHATNGRTLNFVGILIYVEGNRI